MANRRLFSKKVIYRDSFATLSDRAKILYLYMNLEADDDGFIGHMKQVLMMSGANRKTLEILKEREFIIEFRSGVCAVTHWRVHNTIARDRYSPTEYREEMAKVELLPSGIYELR